MPAIVADASQNDTKLAAPVRSRWPISQDDLSRDRSLHLLQTVVLILMILGTFLVSGIAAPRIPGVATAVRSAGVTVAAPAMSARAITRPGNCPGSSSPCP